MDETPDEFLPTRRSLLTRLKHWDDQEGWREFFDTYWRLIYNTALKAGLAHAEAEDLVQETIIAVARKMPRFNYDPALGSFKTWLLLNVRSRIADHLRRASADKRSVRPLANDGPGTSLAERVPDPSLNALNDIWDEEWHKTLFAIALERIKAKVGAKQFLLFELYALKENPLRQIIQALNVNAGQVYLAKHRVGRLLKQEIRRLERGLA